MSTYLSPGVYIKVTDNSQYVASVGTTAVGIVGAASRGPVLGAFNPKNNNHNQPVLVTNTQQFVATFGPPSPEFLGPYAALLYLQQGNQLWYGRVVGSGATVSTKVFSGVLEVAALNEGEWGDSVSIQIADSFVTGAKKLVVYNTTGTTTLPVESYDGLVADPTNVNFYTKIINPASQYIHVTYLASNATQPTNTVGDTPSLGTWEALGGGSDGLPPQDTDIIGAQGDGFATGLWAYSNPDSLVDISALAAPGYTSPAVITSIATVVKQRGDCLGVIHGPQGLNSQEIVDWHNAANEFASGGSTPSVLINQSSMALYWPWALIFDNYNAQNVWIPPVGFALQAFAYNDQVGQVWFAPAGINRGICTSALALEYSPTQGQRDFIYGPGNGNAVNALVNLPLDGITIYGQRTMQRTASSLDRINVQRLVFYCTKSVKRAARFLVFEQDDSILWNQFKTLVTPFLATIKAGRGLYDYLVVCDATTNTPQAVNNNEMYGFILLQPTKTAEKIIITFNLQPFGVTLSASLLQQ